MAHLHQKDAESTQSAKVQSIVGHTKNYQAPSQKAADLAYHANDKLDPHTLPTTEKAAP